MYNKLHGRHSASVAAPQFNLVNLGPQKREHSKGREYESSTDTLRNASHEDSRRAHTNDASPHDDKLKSLITQVSANG